MCGQVDDPTQHDALTPREASAFRAYMIDLDAMSGAMLAAIPFDTPEYVDYREGFGLGVEHKYGNTSQVLPEHRSRSYYRGYEDATTPDLEEPQEARRLRDDREKALVLEAMRTGDWSRVREEIE